MAQLSGLDRDKARERLKADTRAFLRAGGTIAKVQQGLSAERERFNAISKAGGRLTLRLNGASRGRKT